MKFLRSLLPLEGMKDGRRRPGLCFDAPKRVTAEEIFVEILIHPNGTSVDARVRLLH